ncbi:hypothetical protein HID58_089867 [Brassica napus]|uniref:Uncharacterized protein n=1 Tax=Brassica napus TaxID=3708 RepID=A0ABQ7Y0D5_BRANA|nr:hypothetical protein HID58_089867 [Brassica napus]
MEIFFWVRLPSSTALSELWYRNHPSKVVRLLEERRDRLEVPDGDGAASCSGGVFSGDGSYPRSIVAGLYAGGGGFLRFTVAALASRKGRLNQLCLHRLLVTESGGLQSSALPSWNPRSRLMMKLSGNGEDVQEEDSTGSRLACLGFVVIHISELRRNEVVGGKFRRLCEEVSVKSKWVTRVILMAQILTRVQIPASLSRA